MSLLWLCFVNGPLYSASTLETKDLNHLVVYSPDSRAFGKHLNLRNNQKGDKLDFSYTRVLGGGVIPLSTYPLALYDSMMATISPNSLETVILERLPSTYQPEVSALEDLTFLPKVIQNAAALLKEDGTLFIEHWPSFKIFSDTDVSICESALKNPFCAFMHRDEINMLIFYLAYKDKPSDLDLNEKFYKTHYVDETHTLVNQAFEYVCKVLALASADRLRQEYKLMLLSTLRERTPSPVNMFADFFLGEYWMLSRQKRIREFMELNGFKDVSIEKLEQNPHNGRTHVWAIQAKRNAGPVIKPKAASIAAAAGGAASAGTTE